MYACANLSFLFKEKGSLLQRYKAAASAGFRYVESDFPSGFTPEEIGQAAKENGLQQVLINCFSGNHGEMGFAATPGQEEEFQRSFAKTLEYTKATNCKKIHMLSGCDLGAERFQEQVKVLKQNLQWASTQLETENLIGLIEPINPYSKPGYFLQNYDIAASVIEEISSPYICLQLDLFHLQMIAGNVTHNIQRLLPLTGHVQVAQSPLRHEPSAYGELDMKYAFSILRQGGYNGYVGCEYTPSGSTEDSLSWIQDCGLTL